MGMSLAEFERRFQALTGNRPLSWQVRLFEKHFAQDKSPKVIDLPTGLGKTMVMAIWLIARSDDCTKLPRRLIYVVDRRTVVDQATDIAEEFAYLLAPESSKHFQHVVKRKPKLADQKGLFATELGHLRSGLGLGDTELAISTLRGQLADNREWSRDPSHPAIIIGTVDLIGSGLLFSGYRSSYKRRPLEAGLLGQDSLLVLDEAHLSKPFEKLIASISCYQKAHGNPMRVIRMSATSGESTNSFTLQFDSNGSLTDEDARDAIITERFKASKTLSLEEVEKPVDAIATAADRLATDKPGTRIVIFVRTPKLVADVRKALEKKNRDYAIRIARLTGTMRGLERDELVNTNIPLTDDDHERRVMQRFLTPDNDPSHGACFLISTSAGEVGFDLNADHMVCDATTIDSLIQRLGRVNRRGKGDAQIHLFVEPPKKEKDGKRKKLEGLVLAIDNAVNLLNGITDVSPKNIAALRRSGVWKDKYDGACAPAPTMVELTDILLDAWSMTSITEPMPGRPAVGTWLRGIDDELPQTTIAWRAELDVDGFADLDLDDIEEWFDTHRILTHEALSVKTSDAAAWLKDRWDALSEAQRRELDKRPIVIDRAGLEVLSVGEVVSRVSRKSADADAFLRDAEIIVPASFGGIRRGVGLLEAAEPKLDKDEENRSPEEQESIDVADVRRGDVLGRFRERVEKPEDGEAVSTALDPTAVKPAKCARYALELVSDENRSVRLVSYVPKREKLDWGTKQQTLAEHVGLVRQRMNDLLGGPNLPEDIKTAARLAAEYHDHGKNRERWQRCAGCKDGEPPLGKSGGAMKRDPRGYRHEFGSLREFTEAFEAGKLLDNEGKPISQDVFDLAMHLIATHHGRGRPHFPKGAFDPDCERRSDEIHTDAIRRFARLQRKYGWWRLAWLENLLRCADALASAEQDAEDVPADTEGGKP